MTETVERSYIVDDRVVDISVDVEDHTDKGIRNFAGTKYCLGRGCQLLPMLR